MLCHGYAHMHDKGKLLDETLGMVAQILAPAGGLFVAGSYLACAKLHKSWHPRHWHGSKSTKMAPKYFLLVTFGG